MKEKKENPLFKDMLDLVNKGSEEELVFFVDNHQELLKEDPILFIGLHVSFYANKDDISNVIRVINYYKQAPYISMEVEDFLNELLQENEKLNKRSLKSDFNIEKLEKMLLSKDESQIASCLQFLSKQNIRLYLDLIEKFLLSDTKYKYKTLALFILVEQKISQEIIVEKDGIIYSLEPSSLCLPFDDFAYMDCKNYIEHSNESMDVISLAIEALNISQIKEYPNGFVDFDNVSLMGDIFIQIGRGLLRMNEEYQSISKKYSIDLSKVEQMAIEIKDIINN
ncbi:MAG: hypothetical protein PUA56_00380 [Bacillales bacterium]|nr:hypothetical protein [Bacillales bacterium]